MNFDREIERQRLFWENGAYEQVIDRCIECRHEILEGEAIYEDDNGYTLCEECFKCYQNDQEKLYRL